MRLFYNNASIASMAQVRELEQLLLLDATMIVFERQKYQKESQDIDLHLKSISARVLTSFDRQRLQELEGLAKKKQLLNAREERYFDGLRELEGRLD